MDVSSATPGWYDDPADPGAMRWWDGTGWTHHTEVKPLPISTSTVSNRGLWPVSGFLAATGGVAAILAVGAILIVGGGSGSPPNETALTWHTSSTVASTTSTSASTTSTGPSTTMASSTSTSTSPSSITSTSTTSTSAAPTSSTATTPTTVTVTASQAPPTPAPTTAPATTAAPATTTPTTVATSAATAALSGGGCDPNYAGACVPIASDVDCAGGSGNGPAYVRGPVQVVGSDIYGLDRDNDGIGCES